MTTGLILQFIIALGIGGLLKALVDLFFNRNKVKAETVSVDATANKTNMDSMRTLVDAAQNDAQQTRVENARLLTRLDQMQARLDAHDDEISAIRDEKRELEQWSRQVYAVLTDEQKTHVGPPPIHFPTAPKSAT